MDARTPLGGPSDESPERDLAGALHDVSNALTVILGWAEGADPARDPARIESALRVIAAQARHAKTIARRAIGAVVAEDEQVSVREPLESVITALGPEAAQRRVRIENAVDAPAANALVRDTTSLRQVLVNLLLNAVSVSPPSGRVRIDGRLTGPRLLTLGVSDEGPGVEEHLRATVLTAGRSTRAGGAGVGLRHAAALARHASGALVLAPSTVGARFELTWPCVPADSPTASRRFESLADLFPGTRVLVVEDDDAVLELLETALGARGADVVGVRHATELPQALLTGTFDAALLDLSPIQADVAGAVASVRKASPEARLVVISGSAVSLAGALDSSDVAWVRKPFEISEIVRAIRARAPK